MWRDLPTKINTDLQVYTILMLSGSIAFMNQFTVNTRFLFLLSLIMTITTLLTRSKYQIQSVHVFELKNRKCHGLVSCYKLLTFI